MSGSTDLAALMRLAQGGDEDAYRRLLAHLAIWLRVVARRGLIRAGGRAEDCEDVVQDTLLAVHLKRHTWDRDQKLEPWLRAIAHHKLVDHLRRRGFRSEIDIDSLADTLPAASAPDDAGALDARQMLKSLPALQRQIVEAISIEGHSARDVGARLGMSEGAVRVALHRALKGLAAAWRREAS